MGDGFGWGGGFVGMFFMVVVSVVVIAGIIFFARWAMEQGGRGRKPPAG
jgi:uncharacterized membrane protein